MKYYQTLLKVGAGIISQHHFSLYNDSSAKIPENSRSSLDFSNILGITKSMLLLYCSKNPFACFFPLFINLFVSDIFCHFHVLFPSMTYHCLHIFFTFRTFVEPWQLAHTSPRLWYSLYPSPFTVRYPIFQA